MQEKPKEIRIGRYAKHYYCAWHKSETEIVYLHNNKTWQNTTDDFDALCDIFDALEDLYGQKSGILAKQSSIWPLPNQDAKLLLAFNEIMKQ